ncbi:MAG: hypothetical protein M3209_00235 [Acidobacteriota bacterium]|nr:hypothetical protein [Acidobacteriota bacterium]
MKKLPKPVLVIKLNDNAFPSDCSLCGNPTNPNIGAELMIEGTNDIVCRSCGYSIAPHLVALLNLGESARFFTNSENDFGAMQTAFNSNVVLFQKEAA